MEFFEKAHVIRKQPITNDTKSEGNMKRQLKQMLYGYRKSDNELIKTSANVNYDINDINKSFDDSASVSGFSDLNLTPTDNEADNSQDTTPMTLENSVITNSDEDVSNSSDFQSLDLSENRLESSSEPLEESLENSLESSSEPLEESLENIPESITENNDYLDSLSEEISDESIASSDDLSFTEAFEATSTEGSNDSDVEFDPNGSLASKILEKLGKKEVNKKSKRRKLDDLPKKHKQQEESVISYKKKNDDCIINLESLSIKKDDEEDSSTQDSASTNHSSPFISISASDMPDQSLRDILGDYRHPIVRNLPSEKQNIVYSTNSLGLFSTECYDMQVEDVDSLIPELGDDNFIEDLELDEELNSSMPLEESTDVYDTLQSESVVELSTDEEYVNPVKVFYGNHNACIFILKHPIEIFVNGKVRIKPLGGTIEVFGHVLKEEVNLYAPNHNYAQCIKTIEKESAFYGLFGKLTSEGLTVAEAEEIVTTIGEYDGVIRMKLLNDCKMDFVDNNFPFTDLFSKPNKNIDKNLRIASSKLNCSLYLSKPWRYFEENDSWNLAIDYGLCVASRGIICGGKGLGKSSFLRYYVNKMLNNGPILVIDLDPGQAEFTVAGNVSATVLTEPIIGPNFTHLKTPEIMLNIGMINIMDNVVRYATAVAELIAQCRTRYSHLPWIINTMGMCNYMGLKFIIYTILHAKPTFLLQIDSQIIKKRFPCDLTPSNVMKVYFEECKGDKLFKNTSPPGQLHYSYISTNHVEGSDRHNSSLAPKEDRYLNFLAYFGELLYVHRGMDLLGILPYEVNISDIKIVTNVRVAAESVTKVLNGKLVALCQLDGSDKGVFTLEDKPLRCHGHGLIRSVDYEKGILYIITPILAVKLSAVNTLLYADWVPELGGQEGSLPTGTPIPYCTSSAQQHKQLMLSPRRRFNPLQLLKLSRNA